MSVIGRLLPFVRLTLWTGSPPCRHVQPLHQYKHRCGDGRSLPRQGAALGRALLSDLAKELAQRRHKAGNDAKKWVQSEWEAHKADYNHNKSAFARDYVRRLRREREVDVKEKQLKEVWLKDIPRLPKNGLPAADRVMTDP